MGKKSDYKKLLDSLTSYSGIDRVRTIEDLHEAIEKIHEYLEGVPWNYMKPENRRKLEGIIDEYVENLVSEKKEYIIKYWREHTPRYRPSYEKVLEYILDHPEYYTLYMESPMKAYREIAQITGYSWRTVRDAFWSFRRAGILE